MLKQPPTKLVLALLVAVAALGLACLALRPREPTYNGKGLSRWIDQLDRLQTEGKTSGEVQQAEQQLTNAVRAMGTNAARAAAAWIRDRPRESLYDEIRYRVESAFGGRFELPYRKDRSGNAIWIFQILGPEAKQSIPDLAPLLTDDQTGPFACRCLSALGSEAVPALSNAVVNAPKFTCREAIDALAELGPAAAPTAPLLRQIIQTNGENTWRALRGLAEIESNAAGLLPTALEHLADAPAFPAGAYNFGAAPGAAYALARIGAAATPPLLEALVSTNAVTRACALAAFDPPFQDMLAGKRASDFYTRSGHFESVFARQMTTEAFAATSGRFPDTYHQKLRAIAQQYTSDTNPAIRSAAEEVITRLDSDKSTNPIQSSHQTLQGPSARPIQ